MKLEIITKNGVVHKIFNTGTTHEEVTEILKKESGNFAVTGITNGMTVRGVEPKKTTLTIRVEDIASILLVD